MCVQERNAFDRPTLEVDLLVNSINGKLQDPNLIIIFFHKYLNIKIY